MRESDIYAPVKSHLEACGYVVRAEVKDVDVVGLGAEGEMVAVELKVAFGLPVLYQAVARLPAVDLVYVAVPAPEGRKARGNWDAQVPDAVRLCRMLGVGLIEVRDGLVVVHCDPGAYQPRKNPNSRTKLLSEFKRRSGDHNIGGTNKRPRVTAYREDALRIAGVLATAQAPMRPARVRDDSGVEKAAAALRSNVYSWYSKVGAAQYVLSEAGADALRLYADVVAAQATPRVVGVV